MGIENADTRALFDASVARQLWEAKHTARPALSFPYLASITGISARSIIRYIEGERAPLLGDFYVLAEALGLDADEVLAKARHESEQA